MVVKHFYGTSLWTSGAVAGLTAVATSGLGCADCTERSAGASSVPFVSVRFLSPPGTTAF